MFVIKRKGFYRDYKGRRGLGIGAYLGEAYTIQQWVVKRKSFSCQKRNTLCLILRWSGSYSTKPCESFCERMSHVNCHMVDIAVTFSCMSFMCMPPVYLLVSQATHSLIRYVYFEIDKLISRRCYQLVRNKKIHSSLSSYPLFTLRQLKPTTAPRPQNTRCIRDVIACV